MIYDLLYIVWNPSEVIFHLGSLGIRWYSMCWLVGLFLGYLLMSRLYKEQRIPEEKFDPLLFTYLLVFLLALDWVIAYFISPIIFYQRGIISLKCSYLSDT